MKIFSNFFILTRAWSFTISAISISLATIVASNNTKITLSLYVLTLIAGLVFHGAANSLNDYLDLKNNTDTPKSPTALYRPHPVFSGLLTPKELLFFSVILFLCALILGCLFAIFISPCIWLLLITGSLIAIFYTTAPFGFKYKALGEVAVFLAFGPLLMEGAYYIQTANLSTRIFLMSIPIGLLTALVLFADNMRDFEFDLERGVKTLPIMVGKNNCVKFYAALSLSTYLFVCILIISGVLPITSLMVFICLPFSLKLIVEFNANIPNNAGEKTSQTTLLFGLLLIVSNLIKII